MDGIDLHINEDEKRELDEIANPNEISSIPLPFPAVTLPPPPPPPPPPSPPQPLTPQSLLTLNATPYRNNEVDLRYRLNPSQNLPFGIEPNKYLTWDLKQAAIYMGEFVIPRILITVENNRGKFKALYLMGEQFEHVSLKTCTLFNQNRPCFQGPFHKDTINIDRGHFCTICWETLWVLASHRVVTCPLTTRKFWSEMSIEID